MESKQGKSLKCPTSGGMGPSFHNFAWGVLLLDNENRVVYANKKIRTLFGKEDKNFIRLQRVEEAFPGVRWCLLLEDKENNINEGTIEISGQEFIVRIEKWNGETGVSKLICLIDMASLEKVCRDSRWYKELEEELNAILEFSYDGIFITDRHGKVLQVNKACERIENIKAENVIGKNMRDLVKEGLYSESVSMRVIKEKKPVTIIQKTGNGKEIIVTGTPVIKDGKMIKVITNERDITELNMLKRQLEEKMEITLKYERELEHLRAKNINFDNIIAKSQTMRNLIQMAVKLAEVDTTILIQGESGVGKEVLAKLIYQHSSRKKDLFIDINCGAIPENLLESELFGYEKGAFTGARKEGKPGIIEVANGGTLFLDEVGELPLNLQVKLLRFLQERKIMRVGGTETIPVDVRVIAATNKDLQKAVQEGSFRADLFYRLSVVPLTIPPLRQRKEDIEPLAYYFLNKFNKQYGLEKELSIDTVKVLLTYEWPGNVRELENLVERLVITCPEKTIRPEHLGTFLLEVGHPLLSGNSLGSLTLKEAVEKFERSFLLQMMNYYKGTVELARAMGVDRSTITRKLKRYGIKIDD